MQITFEEMEKIHAAGYNIFKTDEKDTDFCVMKDFKVILSADKSQRNFTTYKVAVDYCFNAIGYQPQNNETQEDEAPYRELSASVAYYLAGDMYQQKLGIVNGRTKEEIDSSTESRAIEFLEKNEFTKKFTLEQLKAEWKSVPINMAE